MNMRGNLKVTSEVSLLRLIPVMKFARLTNPNFEGFSSSFLHVRFNSMWEGSNNEIHIYSSTKQF